MSFGMDSAERTGLITVRDALALEPVRRGIPEVVTGADYLGRSVRWVHAGEVPNMASLLKGGELLLTTGMGINSSDDGQRRFVAELADRSVAALTIELGSTFSSIPDAVVSEAERCGLPLIALHREVPFVEITEALHREIVNRQFVVMRRSADLHQRFTELVFGGAGIPEVLAALADAVANPVLLEKHGHGVLYHATHHTASASVLAAWQANRQSLPGGPDTLTFDVPTTGRDRWGRLALVGIDSPIEQFDRVAVERAVELIALVLLRDRQEDVLAGRERGNFLSELLSRGVGNAEAARRAGELGFARDPAFLLPMALMRSPRMDVLTAKDEPAWALVWRYVRRELESMGVPSIVGARPAEGDILLVLGLADAAERVALADRVTALIESCAVRQLGARGSVVVCVGAAARSWTAVGDRLQETVAALPAAGVGDHRPWHDASRADLHRLLWSLRENDDLRSFAEQRLAPLVEHDRERPSKLLPTLAAYCEHGGRKAETARALHLERQSLYHRLDRIERLLGEDLSDDDTMLALHLALRSLPYLE